MRHRQVNGEVVVAAAMQAHPVATGQGLAGDGGYRGSALLTSFGGSSCPPDDPPPAAKVVDLTAGGEGEDRTDTPR